MKVISSSVCFIGVLLIGNVISWNWSDEDLSPDPDLFDIDSQAPEEDDYPQYFFVEAAEEEGTVNTEENEVDKSEERPKPDTETVKDEDDQPDLGPLPDPDTFSLNIISEKVDKLVSDFKAQQDKIAELEDANKRLTLKIDSIEQQTKTNSIILTNVRESPNESSKTTLKRVLHVFNRIMRVHTSASDIAVALRANGNSSSRNKPIVVRFTNFATKMRVLAASNRLSHTDMTVSSDYSELVAQRRAALVPYLQQARANGQRAFILYDKLVVDGILHSLEELKAQKESNEQSEMLGFDPRLK